MKWGRTLRTPPNDVVHIHSPEGVDMHRQLAVFKSEKKLALMLLSLLEWHDARTENPPSWVNNQQVESVYLYRQLYHLSNHPSRGNPNMQSNIYDRRRLVETLRCARFGSSNPDDVESRCGREVAIQDRKRRGFDGSTPKV